MVQAFFPNSLCMLNGVGFVPGLSVHAMLMAETFYLSYVHAHGAGFLPKLSLHAHGAGFLTELFVQCACSL